MKLTKLIDDTNKFGLVFLTQCVVIKKTYSYSNSFPYIYIPEILVSKY